MKNTSREAYIEKIKSGTIDNDYSKIYNLLKSNGRLLTYSEIAYHLNWSNPNKVSRRMLELVKQGLVLEGPAKRCSIARSNCTTYTFAI